MTSGKIQRLSIEQIWRTLEASPVAGTLRRVDDSHPGSLYAGFDGSARRGLLLFSDAEPPELPPLKSLAVVKGQQPDGRWCTAIWLCTAELSGLFSALCDDVIAATRVVPPKEIGEFFVTRLQRWRRLFELAGSSMLPLWELRGLVAELIVMNECFKFFRPADVIEAWGGPLGAAQDFALPEILLEAKAVGPSAVHVSISSADQLDAPFSTTLILAVVRLASAAENGEAGFAIPQLVADISGKLAPSPTALEEFYSRLSAAGYLPHSDYERIWFRLDGLNYFTVGPTFPRITRAGLMDGIGNVHYDITLSSIEPFERLLNG